LIDRQQIIVDDHALGGLRPVEAVDPLAMGPRPVPPAAQEQLAQAVAAPLQIFTGIITRGGIFVSYTRGPAGIVGESVSDQNGLHGSARDAVLKGVPWVPAGTR